MDPFIRLLIMMRRMSQRRITAAQFWFLMAILGFALALGLVEYVFGWPDWLTADPPRIHRTPVLQ